MARLTTIRQENIKDEGLLPIIFEKGFSKKKLSKTEITKVALFEKGLANELSRTDTIEQSVTKIVKMALVCEFGTGLITRSGAKTMIETISKKILGERSLRRSALIIADRFACLTVGMANIKRSKDVTVKGRQGKKSLNG